jgi:hypothetical protein
VNSSDTLVYAKALSASKLRASLDRAGRAAAARPGICYVADDHGLGRDVTHFCLVQPDALLEQTFIAMAS